MKKGFTLVEVIVVLVIVALIAAIAVPSIIQYREIYEQRNRDNIARSIFVAASNSITQKSTGGVLKGVLNEGNVIINNLVHNESDYYLEELNANIDNIAYMSLSAGEGSENELYKLLEPYVLDKTILNHAILIEYNTVTGRVLSAFYSDKVVSLGYGRGTDVTDRTARIRKESKVGYYGVKTTGVPFDVGSLVDIDASVIDYINPNEYGYGLLTAEVVLPNIDLSTAIFDLYINSSKFLTFGDSGVGVPLSIVSHDLTYAFNNPINYDNKNHVIYIKQQDDHNVLVVVLDSINVGFGIDRYTSINGNVSIKAVAKMGTSDKEAYSNTEHSLFDFITQDTFYISSIRHLNNVRRSSSSSFIQNNDIYAYDYTATNTPDSKFRPIDNLIGVYDGNGKIISHLTTTADNAGLFSQVYSIVKNVVLSKPNISGVLNAGGIAAINNGTITNCKVGTVESNANIIGVIKSTGVSSNVGGVAGVNNSVIENCVNGVEIRNSNSGLNTYAGGIAGYNKSNINKSYNVGPVFGNGYIGGIAGANTNLVQNSYNNGRVNIERGAVDTAGNNDFSATDYVPAIYKVGFATGGVSGGIVGINNNIIRNSYSTNYVGNREGGLFGHGNGTIEGSYYLVNSYNKSQIYNNVEYGLNYNDLCTKISLPKSSTSIGRFNYIYPYILDNTHDLPWEKVTTFVPSDVKGMIWLENKNTLELHFISYGMKHGSNSYIDFTINFLDNSFTDVTFRLTYEDLQNILNYYGKPLLECYSFSRNGFNFYVYPVNYYTNYSEVETEFCVALSYVNNGTVVNTLPDVYFDCSMVVNAKNEILYRATTEIEHTLYANSDLTTQMGITDTWLIKNTRNLLNLKRNSNDKFSQVDNIIIQDYGAQSFIMNTNVCDVFSGIYNGNNNFIKHLQIDKTGDKTGMFGTNSGTVSNLKLIGPSIKGNSNVGVVCGVNAGNIENVTLQYNETIKGGIDAEVFLNGSVIYLDLAYANNPKVAQGYVQSIPELWVLQEAIYPESMRNLITPNEQSVYYIFYTSTINENRWVHLNINGNRYPLLKNEVKNKNEIKISDCLLAPDDTWSYRLENVYTEFRWKKISDYFCLVETGNKYYSNGTVVITDNLSLPFIVSTNGNAGGIAGHNTGSIIKCINDGVSVEAYVNSGGIVGLNEGVISNCSNKATVSDYSNATQSVGGIAGRSNSGEIRDCINTEAIIKGINNVGGVVGYCQNTKVNNLENNADVVGSGVNVGGVFGFANYVTTENGEGRLANNTSGEFKVVGSSSVGGIAGYMANSSIANNSTALNCILNNGIVSGKKEVGGIAGILVNSTLGNQSYSLRQVVNYAYNIGKGEKVGTIIGYLQNSSNNSYIYNYFNSGTVFEVYNLPDNVWPANSGNQPIIGYADITSGLNEYIIKRN